MKNICIYGVGGVGGYFGAKMIQNNSNNHYHISLIARGNHLDKIQKSGLKLIGEKETVVVHPDMAVYSDRQTPFARSFRPSFTEDEFHPHGS